MSTGKIYAAIAAVSSEAGALAPTKNGAGVPFAFRGVDATVAHVAPYLKKHGIVVFPEVVDSFHSAREVGSKVVTQTEIRTAFHFVHIEDGSEVVATTIGLAQDFSDRSAAQAQSVAFRVAILQTFTLPTHEKEPEEVGEIVQKGIAEEKANATPKTPAKPTVAALKQQVGALVSSGRATGAEVDAYGDLISKTDKAEWSKDGRILDLIVKHFTVEMVNA